MASKLKNELEELYMLGSLSNICRYDEDKGNFHVYIETGGASGGNCWGDSASYYSVEIEEFDLLQNALLKLYPEIKLREYMTLYGLMSVDDKTEDEYYGNHTEYRVYTIRIPAMEHKLKEWGYES